MAFVVFVAWGKTNAVWPLSPWFECAILSPGISDVTITSVLLIIEAIFSQKEKSAEVQFLSAVVRTPPHHPPYLISKLVEGPESTHRSDCETNAVASGERGVKRSEACLVCLLLFFVEKNQLENNTQWFTSGTLGNNIGFLCTIVMDLYISWSKFCNHFEA